MLRSPKPNQTKPNHTIPYHTIPYHTIPYHGASCCGLGIFGKLSISMSKGAWTWFGLRLFGARVVEARMV